MYTFVPHSLSDRAPTLAARWTTIPASNLCHVLWTGTENNGVLAFPIPEADQIAAEPVHPGHPPADLAGFAVC